ncbi:MAG TPA: hypothetical protein DCG48_13075 [Rhodospirillaceae bacterium]|nr:hypothetical protein [Rhodospirillaceae bacterium]|tara:strand:- start:306 stop:536 length:231 start_codon:yes stop_codon:yes gene_type:complete
MANDDEQFEKADIILSNALQEFMSGGVSQEVYGMAMLEIGILALVRLDESDDRIAELVADFIARARQGLPDLPPGQ